MKQRQYKTAIAAALNSVIRKAVSKEAQQSQPAKHCRATQTRNEAMETKVKTATAGMQ